MTTDLILLAVMGVLALGGYALVMWRSSQDRRIGAELQAGRAATTAAKASAAVAQAAAQRPTDAQVDDRLARDTF